MEISEAAGLIRRSMEKYPLSTPQDVVKLLYQSEFGPGHAVRDREAAREWLYSELESVDQEEGELTEPIGGGYARAYLSRLSANGVSPDELLEAFIASAEPAGSREGFAALIRALEFEELPLDMSAFRAYAESYIALGCPAVHHSPVYREAYSPAYRVIRPELIKTEQ